MQPNKFPSMYAPESGYAPMPKKHFDKVALIDADKLKHLVAYDVNELLKINQPRDPARLVSIMEERLKEVFSRYTAIGYIFCFSGKSHDTFRAKVAFEREYKGSRKNDPSFYEGKIEDMAELVRYVSKSYPTLLFPDLEADDLLCFLQCEHTFIDSNDKDLDQIPGHHYCKMSRDLKIVTPEQAHRSLCYQMIKGDSVDCITGLKGYGHVNAEKLLEQVPLKQMLGRILYEYQVKYGIENGMDAFAETWNLVKLRGCRGVYFQEKYRSAKDLLSTILRMAGK